jgi:Xaa-Pro aminopeptidase
MRTQVKNRKRALFELLRKSCLDAYLATNPADWFYLSGFTGEAGALVASSESMTLVTDSRFTAQARAEMGEGRVVQQKGALFSAVGGVLSAKGWRRVGYDPNSLTVAQLGVLRKAAGRGCSMVQAPGVVQALRGRKDASELAQMRKAAILASEVMESGIRMLKPGVRELEIAAEIEYRMRKGGGSAPAFETIVAFGERAALPHARPTSKRLRKNELVVLDLGVILGHYCSDITRTVFAGRAPRRVREWHRAVQEAQEAAISAARAGVACEAVDAAARRVLASYKLDQFFIHSTGHGLGLEVHEEPRIAKGQKRLLEEGNVITIEPGVYVEGVGGIRIEDDVAIQRNGTEILTRGTRNLIEL